MLDRNKLLIFIFNNLFFVYQTKATFTRLNCRKLSVVYRLANFYQDVLACQLSVLELPYLSLTLSTLCTRCFCVL